jgi:predicted TIM-barrel fold metal-dependent hydrolase
MTNQRKPKPPGVCLVRGRSRVRHTWMRVAFAIAVAALAAGCEAEVGPAGEPGPQGPPGPQGEPPGPAAPLDVDGAALDAHTHLMSPGLTEILAGPGVPASTADDLIERLDEANVARAVVLSLAYFPDLPDEAAVRAENDFTAAEVAKYPDRLIGFCGINPLRRSDLDELDRCIDDLEMTGVKIHLPAIGLDLRRPEHAAALNAVFDRVAAKGVPVLMHVGAPLGIGLDSDAFTSLGTIVATHPSVRLTWAHCTNDGEIDDIDTWLQGMRHGLFAQENMFVDTSSCLEFYKEAPLAQKELMVWRLRQWGMGRVLFASDYLRVQPAATPVAALTTLASYPFTQGEIDLILNNDGSSWLDREL